MGANIKEIMSTTSYSMAAIKSKFISAFNQGMSIVGTGGHYEDPRNGKNWGFTPYHDESDGWRFVGWQPSGQSINFDVPYNIDDFRWQKVTIPAADEPPWTFTINETLTPIVYARNEQRAIIPSDSIIRDINFDLQSTVRQPPVQISSVDIQTMIMNALTKTNSYMQGYRPVYAFTNDEQKYGMYMMRGLFIKDTYKYADEDTVPDVDFRDDSLEDGYTGTINVYGNFEKLNTLAFGDDVYAIGPNEYIWLSGYTDAIIYDGERIESPELNASHAEPTDKQTEILLSPNGDYKDLLWNRKRRTSTFLYDIQYGWIIDGAGNRVRLPNADQNIKHVVDLIARDKDVYITGTNNLNNPGDWVLFVPVGTNINDPNKLVRGAKYPIIEILSQDIIAHNDEHYQSPILNYRFNLEDPDAYTCYYEILPTCDPKSPYKNVVLVHIYYARNIYIQDENNLSGSGQNIQYIQSFGLNNIATRSSRYYLNSEKIAGQTYFRDDYIDDYIWFQAKPMYESRPYRDEKPNQGMDSFYGNVNGRYRENNPSGKQDLRVVTPQFNLPTTIDANNINIYIMVTEFYPSDALVAYAWEHPSSEKDSVTHVNGDYVTFSSDSITYKDRVTDDLLQTMNTGTIELFDSKTVTKFFEMEILPNQADYDHYYIELYTDNSDVLALNYPSEIMFDKDTLKSEFGANFKSVVNATTKWSPRIHNGYYYLNQHEYYAYSQFDIEANFESYNEENFKHIEGYLTIDVNLIHDAKPTEHYDILKNTRAELLQNERGMKWVDGKGLTIKPIIDGEYFKEYTAVVYTSPVILFRNVLTSAGKLRVDYYYEDGSDYLPMQVRSYNLEEGKWNDWVPFLNDSVPNCPLSCAYQVRFTLAASIINNQQTIEDYLCCYLDWVDDGDTPNHVNCITITDHLQAGPYKSKGIFYSKIIDYDCMTTVSLDIFESGRNDHCQLYIATDNFVRDNLLLENAHWTAINGVGTVTTRYLRYKIEIPYGEQCYWLHKKIDTTKSDVYLPYVEQIQMTGDYTPSDVRDRFQENASFSIITDGKSHQIFPSVYDIISGEIAAKGYEDTEIESIRLKCTSDNINISFDSVILSQRPTVEKIDIPVYATADFSVEISVKHSPFILTGVDPEKELDLLKITKGTPQQFAPITMEDDEGIPYQEVFDVDPDTLIKTEIFNIESKDDQHYLKLSRNDFDIKTLSVLLNDEPFDMYHIVNNLLIFETNPEINDIITVKYNILYSFYTEIDYENDKTQMTIYSEHDKEQAKKEEIMNLVPITEWEDFTDCRLSQIYANGTKIAFNKNMISIDTKWGYDANIPAIYYPANTDNFTTIINELFPVSTYQMEFVAYSENSDNDIIGFIIGCIRDSDERPHTLSLLVSLGIENDSDASILFSPEPLVYYNMAIILDYGKNSSSIVAGKTIQREGFIGWNEIPNGIKFHIEKEEEIVRCKISNWNEPEVWNEDSLLEINLNDREDTKAYNKNVYYGFCTQSQKDTYFVGTSFTGRISHTITVEEQMEKLQHKYKVYFETNKTNNKFTAEDLSLNPIYRTDYKGFIYLTDEHNEPYKINIYRNPKYINAGGYDKIDISIECLDYLGNPIINKNIDIDCNYGIINFDNPEEAEHLTDMNGVIHILYESAPSACTDILTARTTTSDGKVVESSVDIINE